MVRKKAEDGDKTTVSFRSNRVMTLMIAAVVAPVIMAGVMFRKV